MTAELILVVGGYGVVGSRIAVHMAPEYPNRVVVAGRSAERAESAAATIGNGARGRARDVTVPSAVATALEDVGLVISCVDQPRRGLLHAAIERGARYTDITLDLVGLGRGGGV